MHDMKSDEVSATHRCDWLMANHSSHSAVPDHKLANINFDGPTADGTHKVTRDGQSEHRMSSIRQGSMVVLGILTYANALRSCEKMAVTVFRADHCCRASLERRKMPLALTTYISCTSIFVQEQCRRPSL